VGASKCSTIISVRASNGTPVLYKAFLAPDRGCVDDSRPPGCGVDG
jgi:hypothetical protein